MQEFDEVGQEVISPRGPTKKARLFYRKRSLEMFLSRGGVRGRGRRRAHPHGRPRGSVGANAGSAAGELETEEDGKEGVGRLGSLAAGFLSSGSPKREAEKASLEVIMKGISYCLRLKGVPLIPSCCLLFFHLLFACSQEHSVLFWSQTYQGTQRTDTGFPRASFPPSPRGNRTEGGVAGPTQIQGRILSTPPPPRAGV